jgi:O-antigen ligase
LSVPAGDRLAAAVGRLDPEERRLLHLSLVEGFSDEEVAGLVGGDAADVMWRRAELVNRLAEDVGVTEPSDVPGVSDAVAALPAGAWTEADAERKPSRPDPWELARRAGMVWLLALPGALTAYLAFQSGGYFPGTTGAAAVVVLLTLVVRLTVAERPFEGFSRGLALAAAALAAFTIWTLVSGGRSDSPARALVEFDRALLYLAVVVLAGSVRRTPERLRWMLRGLAAAFAVVCAAALASRVLPDLISAPVNLQNDRLSYPLSYWNAMGLFAALGAVLSFALTSDEREPWPVRVLAAGSLPILGSTLLLTFSRSAIAVVAIGIVAFVVLARTRGFWTGAVAAGPATAVALATTYDADLVATDNYTSAAAMAQGDDVALAVGLACAGALVLRALLIPVDARLGRIHLPDSARRPVLAGATAIAAVGGIALALALHAPRELEDQYHSFVDSDVVETTGPTRDRLGSAANNGRIEFWRVARDTFQDDPLAGRGAGSYQLVWAQERPSGFTLVDAHSLYLEVAAELGLVGLVALAIGLLMLLGGALVRCRGRQRAPYAAVAALGITWLVHAGLDWDWEMPAVTLPFFALGAFALAGESPRLGAPPRLARIAGAVGLLVIAVTPALLQVSQARLDDAVLALRHGDCTRAIDRALASNSVLGVRPEPFEVLGYCDARRRGSERLGVVMMKRAVDRDPDFWRYWYGLALVRGAARLDPRPAAHEARRLNPRSSLTRGAVRRFDTDRPAAWERAARSSRLPFNAR